jgi:hypothetical protein
MAIVINAHDVIIQEANRLGLDGVKRANAKMGNAIHGAARHLVNRTRAIKSGEAVPIFADLNSTIRRLGH